MIIPVTGDMYDGAGVCGAFGRTMGMVESVVGMSEVPTRGPSPEGCTLKGGNEIMYR